MRKLKGEGKYLFEFGIVDLNMLRRQKYQLLNILERKALTTGESDAINGIVNLLEAIDDYAELFRIVAEER